MDASTTGLEPGTLVGEYVVVERLRVDGVVVAHRARQSSVDRTVELHVLDAESRSDAFLARARAIAGVDHPHVLPVYDAGVERGRVFAVTRLAGGRPLERVLTELTQLVQAPARGRLTVVDVGSHAVVILEDTPDGRSLPETQKLLASLRLG
jgi:hypothetical protein